MIDWYDGVFCQGLKISNILHWYKHDYSCVLNECIIKDLWESDM